MKNYAIRNLFNVIREYSALIEEKEKNGTDRWLRFDYLENYNEYLRGYVSALYLSDVITDNQYDLISGWRLRHYNRKRNSYINELK